MWVKVCGITRLEDAVAAARFGADAVGFVFAESPRMVTPEEAGEISRRMPDGPAKVGVFVNSPVEDVNRVVRRCGLDLVQLHGDEDPAYCEELGGIAIKALRVDGALDVALAKQYHCHALLLDGYDRGRRGGTGKTFDWTTVRLLDGRRRVIVAGGLGPDNVGRAIEAARPYGVDASSGVESEPGRKDAVLMYRFIENARRADYEVNGL